MDLQELLARESIRDLIGRYNSNGDAGRFSQVMELFALDAVMEVDGVTYTGVDEILTIFTGTQARTRAIEADAPAYIRHLTASHQIDVLDESVATGRCYFAVLTPIGLDHWGRYVDRYRVVDGRWRFAHRRVTVDGFSPRSLFAPE
jgi:hypothetical protein